MKKPDDIGRLNHIYDAIAKIDSYTSGVEKSAFLKNSMMQDAVMRQIEIIGEASRYISDEFQEKHAELPWFQMWDTVKNDLPPLKAQVQKLLE